MHYLLVSIQIKEGRGGRGGEGIIGEERRGETRRDKGVEKIHLQRARERVLISVVVVWGKEEEPVAPD